MIWYQTKDRLPPFGKYVLARHSRKTWNDSTDPVNVNCVVVKLVQGISMEERVKMESGAIDDPLMLVHWYEDDQPTSSEINRHLIYRAEDEHDNNEKPYNWQTFGPDSFDGQEIIEWTPIILSK